MSQTPFAPDFAEMLSELSASGAEYLVVGAHAVGVHVLPRATKDFDIWVRPTLDNAERVWQALLRFGAPLEELTVNDLATPGLVFQMGRPPHRIDIITRISGVAFEEAWPNRVTVTMGGVDCPVIGRADLIRNKRASARPQDLVDADLLSRHQ
jgi:hypothetical protein